LVQDILVQTLCNSGLGLLIVWMIQLFAIHPALPVAVGVSLLLLLGWLSKIFSRRNNELRERLVALPSLLTPSEEPEPEPEAESSSPVLTCADSLPPVVTQPHPERMVVLEASSSSDSCDAAESSLSDSDSDESSGSFSVHVVEVGGDSPQVYRIVRMPSELLSSSDNLSSPRELDSSLSDSLSE
jgi:hypothetical protein